MRKLDILKIIGCVILLSFFASSVSAQTIYDNPCNVGSTTDWPIDGTCYTANLDNTFSALYDPGSCNSGANDDGYISFTGDGSDITIFYNPGGTRDAVIHLFSAVAACTVTEIACADDFGNNGNETIVLSPSVLGTVYFVRIQRYNSNNNMTGCLSLTSSAPPAPPANDEPCAATPLTVGASCSFGTYTNEDATATAGVPAPGCSDYQGGDVWFTAVVPASGHLIFDSDDNGVVTDGGMAIYSGACGALVLEGCDDDASANGAMSLIDDNTLTPGATIWIRFFEYGNNNNGTFDICVYDGNPGGGGPGVDCSDPIRVDCGDPTLVGQTTFGLGDTEDDWSCDPFVGANNFPGEDQFYVIQWPDGANGGFIRINVTNTSDANSASIELLSLGNSCAPNTCTDHAQFGTGIDGSYEYSVGAGIVDYYFVIDTQIDGYDSYDIEFLCFTSGIALDDNSSCTPIPAGEPANQGYYVTWDGAAPPDTADATAMAAAGPYTICENVYIENPTGFEWIKHFEITLGECWINPANLTPNGNNTQQNSTPDTGDWGAVIGGGSPNVLTWEFTHDGNAAWGDGNVGSYNCYLYTFCYDADVDAACASVSGFQNGISATDDGIGGGGGGSVNASNVTVNSTGPTVLPVILVSFTAKVVMENNRHGVVLNWKTSTEINNDFFTVERSINGVEFKEAFRMQGAGNSNTINNYIGMDEDPYSGISYYRLKQTDFNGAYEYFDMVSVNISFNDDFEFEPFQRNSNIILSVNSDFEGDYTVDIVDLRGKTVLREVRKVTIGNNSMILTPQIASGSYLVRLTSYDRGETYSQKMMYIKR